MSLNSLAKKVTATLNEGLRGITKEKFVTGIDIHAEKSKEGKVKLFAIGHFAIKNDGFVVVKEQSEGFVLEVLEEVVERLNTMGYDINNVVWKKFERLEKKIEKQEQATHVLKAEAGKLSAGGLLLASLEKEEPAEHLEERFNLPEGSLKSNTTKAGF